MSLPQTFLTRLLSHPPTECYKTYANENSLLNKLIHKQQQIKQKRNDTIHLPESAATVAHFPHESSKQHESVNYKHPWWEEYRALAFLGTAAMLDQPGGNESFPAVMCNMQLSLVSPMNGTHSLPNHYPLNHNADHLLETLHLQY